MTQKIIKVGTSAGVVLPKDYLEKAGLKVGTKVELDFLGKKNKIIITYQKSEISQRDEEVGKIALGIINRYREDFNALSQK